MKNWSLAVALVLIASGAWAQSAPLTFRGAVAEALASSPTLRSPDDTRTLAAIREQQAAARFGVKVAPTAQFGTDPSGLDTRSLGVALTKRLPFGTNVQFTGTTTAFGAGPSQFRDNGYTFGFSQPLLRGLTKVASADLDQARHSAQSAGRAYADARQRLVVSVAESYFAVVRSKRLVDMAERTLDRARQLKTLSDARSTVGLATELDVLRADLLISQSEASLVGQREALESASDALRTLIGRPGDSALDLGDADVNVIDQPDDQPVEVFVRSALSSRLEVQDARARIDDARLTESVARWNLLPPLNFDASYTKRGLGGSAAYPLDSLVNGWHLGVSTSYTLDHSDQTAAAAAAAVSVTAAQHDAQDMDRRIADEVRHAYRVWTGTRATVDIQTKAVAIAERQLRLAQLRYDRGVAGNFDVVDAENSLLQSQSALIGAEVDRAIAGLALSRASGTLDPDRFQP